MGFAKSRLVLVLCIYSVSLLQMCLEKSGKTWDFSVQNFFSLESGSPGSTFPHVDGIAISSQEICGFDSWPIHYHGMTRGSIIWYWSKGGMI